MYIPDAACNQDTLQSAEDLRVQDVVGLTALLVPRVVSADALRAEGYEDVCRARKNAHDRAFGRHMLLELAANGRVREGTRPRRGDRGGHRAQRKVRRRPR